MNTGWYGSDEWFAQLKNRIDADVLSGAFWDNILNKDPVNTERRSHLERHVGKSVVELLDRGFSDPVYKSKDKFVSSTFTENVPLEAYLEEVVSTALNWAPDMFCTLALSEQDAKIALQVAMNPSDWKNEFDVMQPCIVMDEKGWIAEKRSNVVRVVFRRDVDAEYGFHLLTAFPDPLPARSVKGLYEVKPKLARAARPHVMETRRDLTPEIVKTNHYQEANTARRAFLQRVADPSAARRVNQIMYDPGDGRYKPSIKVWFPATNGGGEYFARVSEERTIVEPSGKDSRAERLDFSNLEDWDKVHRLNGVAARFLDLLEADLKKNSTATQTDAKPRAIGKTPVKTVQVARQPPENLRFRNPD